MMTWFDASAELKTGDRVRFPQPYDIFSEGVLVPAGAMATVKENGLNEMQPALILEPDDAAIREALHEWDGMIWLYGPDDDAIDDDGEVIEDSRWQEHCPIEKS